MNVKVKRLNDAAVIPQYAKPGDSGFDLVATEDVIIAPGETALVPTSLAFEIPEGYELQVRPRSGVSLRTKLRVANTPGTVDSSFRGEVKVIIDNIAPIRYGTLGEERDIYYLELSGERVLTEIISVCVSSYANMDHYEDRHRRVPLETYIIRKGDRIAQGVIAPVIRANLVETDGELTETARGEGGFGHSGVTAEEFAENTRKAFEALPSLRDYIELDEETRTFVCIQCGRLSEGEVGTWAEENDMCAPCYCEYQGG